MDWVDRVWVGLAWLVGAAAVAVIAWGLAGDWHQRRRSAKRGVPVRRCRRCGYDMRGAASATCPECGRAGTERELTRAWVRKWVVAVGVLLVVPAWVAGRVPEARRVGWDRLMPDVLYVSIAPVNDEDWRARWIRPLDARGFREHGAFARRILAARRASAMRREHPDWLVEVFDATNPDDSEWESAPATVAVSCFSQTQRESRRGQQEDYCRELRNLITGVVETEVWFDNGGDAGEIMSLTDRMVVGSAPRIMLRVRRLMMSMQNRAEVAHLSEEDGILRIRCDAISPWTEDWPAEQHARELRNTIISVALPDAWTDNGGDQGAMWHFRGLLLAQAGPPLRARVAELLQAMDRAATRGEPTRLAPFGFNFPGPDAISVEEHTAVWPLREILVACGGGLSREAWDRWVAADPEHRDPEWRWKQSPGQHRYRGYENHVDTAFESLRKFRLDAVDPQAVENSDLAIHRFGEVLIVLATRPELLDKVEAAYRDLLADVRSGAFQQPSPTSRGPQ